MTTFKHLLPFLLGQSMPGWTQKTTVKETRLPKDIIATDKARSLALAKAKRDRKAAKREIEAN